MSLPVTLHQIAELLGCGLPEHNADVAAVVIDSRKVTDAALFVALPGQHVDGHDYLAAARQAGACAALVSRPVDDPLPQLVVNDVVVAFASIAHFWRQQSHAKVVAITGSNGKTTLKEMTAAILREAGSVLSTEGNLNNELGVPLTLCRLQNHHQYAVIEMGANHPGEIGRLVKIAAPDIAIINNVSAAHIEGFGSEMGVAQAKGEIYAGLPLTGKAVINADMPYVGLWRQLLAGKCAVTFALDAEADIKALDLNLSPTSNHFMVMLDGVCHFVTLPLPGIHNVANGLAAIALTSSLGISAEAIVKGLGNIRAVPHRLQLRQANPAGMLIDDTYNANPGSFSRAIEVLKSFPGRHWLVLGDFGELGPQALQIHRQLGEQAKQAGVHRLFTLGTMSIEAAQAFGEGAQHFTDKTELQRHLQSNLYPEVVCLVKGSRFMKLDQLADAMSAEEGG